MKKIRVLIVDDSALMRKFLTKIISMAPDLEVVGQAPDPYVAREKLIELQPDVMTLDVEMPRMDGLTFLEKVMRHFPTRTIIFSSLTQKDSATALRAFELGAIEVLEKPSLDISSSLEALSTTLHERICTVARASLVSASKISPALKPSPQPSLLQTTHKVLAIASSTGGTEALKVLLSGFSQDIPGTVIVQHMPAGFTKSFADALNAKFPFEVKEAAHGDRVHPGRVLIAPGGYHMELARSGAQYFVTLNQEPFLHGVRPAADLLMKSVAAIAGANSLGVVLTGMGKDGAQGLLQMRKAGAATFSQSERTCVVYGMPQAAENMGAVGTVADLQNLSFEINKVLMHPNQSKAAG